MCNLTRKTARNHLLATMAIMVGGWINTAIAVENEPNVWNGKTLMEWNFDVDGDAIGWTGSHLGPIEVSDGTLKAKFTGQDPFIVSPEFEIVPKAGVVIQFRYRCQSEWKGELFFASSNDGPYNGFSQENSQLWELSNDGNWHIATIHPNWLNEKRIIKFRLDFGVPVNFSDGEKGLEVDDIRVIDMDYDHAKLVTPCWDADAIKRDWKWSDEAGKMTFRSDIFRFDASQFGAIVYLKIQNSEEILYDTPAELRWLGGYSGGVCAKTFVLHPGVDEYNISLDDEPQWNGNIHRMEIVVAKNSVKQEMIKPVKIFVCNEPQGAGRLELKSLYSGFAICREKSMVPVVLKLCNIGGKTIKSADVRLTPNDVVSMEKVSLGDETNRNPSLLQKNSSNEKWNIPEIKPFENICLTLWMNSGEKCGNVAVNWLVSGVDECENHVVLSIQSNINVTKSLNLTRADYVPNPLPVSSDFEIGALYFPGWAKRDAWERIRNTCPERKPVLGWYDESNPEVVDWQIKWARESGIQFFLVDWYWNRGQQSLDHWILAFQKAKYRSFMKWAVMWANHNGPGSHSYEDQAAVTQFWIDHYFQTQEYYTIDGKPVVMIWDPKQMDLDIAAIEAKNGVVLKRGEGVKRLLELSRRMAREAGLPGIEFIAMKWPEAGTSSEDILWLQNAGFDETSIYHFMDHGGRAENALKYSFDLVVDASLPYWEKREKTGILPWIPNLSTGWDSRPWHGDKQTVIVDRNPEKFRMICEKFKNFAEKTGHRRVILAPLNEWGEGSYVEPNAEFGFDMYDTLRLVLCNEPDGGFPDFITPQDVGLGPYDLEPLPEPKTPSGWDFSNLEVYRRDVAQGISQWNSLMGTKDFGLSEENGDTTKGALRFQTTTADPAIRTNFIPTFAKTWKEVVIDMKMTDSNEGLSNNTQEFAQLFVERNGKTAMEDDSVTRAVVTDGAFHEYLFSLETLPSKEKITGLRFDPLNREGVNVEIRRIMLR